MSDCLRDQFSSYLLGAWDCQVLQTFFNRLDNFTSNVSSDKPNDIYVNPTSRVVPAFQGVSSVPFL